VLSLLEEKHDESDAYDDDFCNRLDCIRSRSVVKEAAVLGQLFLSRVVSFLDTLASFLRPRLGLVCPTKNNATN
jgi:hypothetical protein